uniref:Zinc finger, CCHC-type n=1 Tax=Caenorhabditis tropicalis TaxID=1561998 RepID=A0A1I7UNJ4_9PELO
MYAVHSTINVDTLIIHTSNHYCAPPTAPSPTLPQQQSTTSGDLSELGNSLKEQSVLFRKEKPQSEPESSMTVPPSAKDGKWSALGFAVSELYDFKNGVAFDRKTCEKNLEKIMNNKKVDYYEFLEAAQQCRAEGKLLFEKMFLSLGFLAAMNNKQKMLTVDEENPKLQDLNKKEMEENAETEVKGERGMQRGRGTKNKRKHREGQEDLNKRLKTNGGSHC